MKRKKEPEAKQKAKEESSISKSKLKTSEECLLLDIQEKFANIPKDHLDTILRVMSLLWIINQKVSTKNNKTWCISGATKPTKKANKLYYIKLSKVKHLEKLCVYCCLMSLAHPSKKPSVVLLVQRRWQLKPKRSLRRIKFLSFQWWCSLPSWIYNLLML